MKKLIASAAVLGSMAATLPALAQVTTTSESSSSAVTASSRSSAASTTGTPGLPATGGGGMAR